jgi:hypothetical protein
LIDRRRHSSILDVRAFRATYCGTDHYLVVVNVRERLAVSKQTTHRDHMKGFNLNKLNEEETTRNIVMSSQIGTKLCETYTLTWILIEFGKLLERVKIFSQIGSRIL